jgi:acetyl-CoA carboxylase biotin carboxyl carrier protein
MNKGKKPDRPRLDTGLEIAAFERPELGATAELIRELANLLRETGLGELEIQNKNIRVRLARSSPHIQNLVPHQTADVNSVSSAAAAESNLPSAAEPVDLAAHPGTIKSPMVGTAYLAPAPGAANFVEIGKHVKEGQTIIIIEAMKTMNQIQAPRAGRISHIFVENGQPVEYGEPLLIIE